MRKITSLVAALLLSVATFAQAPQGFSYQAVVRDAQNALVANQTVDVTLTITAEVGGVAAQSYTEKHSVTTNANGLFTLVVGQGESNQKLSDIKWNVPGAVYNLRTETIYGTATTQLMSVPFALYAEQAGELDYQKLAKTLTSDDVQAVLGYVKADELAGYVKEDSLYKYALNTSLNNNYVTKETFENYVLSGGQADAVDLTVYAKNADVEATYAKKTDIPATPDLSNYAKKSDVSYAIHFVNDSLDYYYAKKEDLDNYAPLRYVSDSLRYFRSAFVQKDEVANNYVTKESFDNYVLSGGQADAVDLTVYAKTADVEKTYAKKSDIPAAVDLSAYAKTADIADQYMVKTSFATVATSGSYNDLTDRPTIPTVPTAVSKFTNDAGYLKADDITGKQDVIADLETIRSGAALGATALQSHQSLAAYTTTAKLNDTLAEYATIAKLNDTLAAYTTAADVEAAYATKTEVAGIQNAISDIETIRSGAALGATALQEHQSLADYATTAKLNDTLAEYAKTTKLNDTLGHYVTIAELNDKNYITAGDVNGEIDLDGYYSKNEVDALIQSLQTAMAQLTKNANQIGDMPLANVTVKVVYANDYSGSTNIATVSFLGKTLKSGETTFKVPAYSPAFLSVALSTFNVSNKYYTYTVKVNGQYFDNVAYEYQVANENVYNSGNVSTFNYNTSFCKSSLSNIKIGSKEKDDTYNNRAFYQDPKYIYVDVVDAIQDIDLNDGKPKHQSGYTDMEYFENRLLIGVTNAQYNDSYGDQYLVQLYNGGDASPRIGVKPRWYRWSDKTWNPTDDYNGWEAAMGLVHMSNYNQSATFIKPIYAKVPNFIYKNTFTTKTVYKVGTESGTGLGRNGLNANMNNQVVGPFNQTNNTIVIEVSSYTVVN